MSTAPRAKASDFHPEVLRLFDQYVHGAIDRRGFLAGAGKFAVASAGPNIVSGYDVALKMRPGMTDRTSYVIAPSGRIAFVHSEMSYAGHVKSTLAAVEAMKQK